MTQVPFLAASPLDGGVPRLPDLDGLKLQVRRAGTFVQDLSEVLAHDDAAGRLEVVIPSFQPGQQSVSPCFLGAFSLLTWSTGVPKQRCPLCVAHIPSSTFVILLLAP